MLFYGLSMDLAQFQSPDFAGVISSRAICQILNDKSPSTVGLFIKGKTLEIIGWSGIAPNYEHTFSSGAVEPGILYKSPKMHILAVSPRFLESRETKEIVGNYETPEGRKLYAELGDAVTLRSFYMLYLVGEKNETLHKVPLILSIHGVAAARFGEAYKQFRTRMEIAYANAMKSGYRSLNDRFHCLTVFNPTFKPSLEPPNGSKKSWVAVPESVACPKVDVKDFDKFICLNKSQELWAIAATSIGFANQLLKASDNEDSPTPPQVRELVPQTIETTAVPALTTDEIPY
jgi:hypothetical protein